MVATSFPSLYYYISCCHTFNFLHSSGIHSFSYTLRRICVSISSLSRWGFHPSLSSSHSPPLPFFLHLHPAAVCLPLHHLILMHGCIFGLCKDSLTPGGFSWNQFTLPVPSHWSTIYRPSTAGAAGRLFNQYIMCLTRRGIYSGYSPSCKHKDLKNIRNTLDISYHWV